MPTPQKAIAIDNLADQFTRANLAILTDYRGLTVADLQNLRASLRPHGAEFHIAKNTLTRIAAEKAGIEGLDASLEGPLAMMFAFGDIVAPTKAVTDFARTSRILTVKGGVLSNRFVGASEVEALATMPSREVLQARLLGLMVSPMART